MLSLLGILTIPSSVLSLLNTVLGIFSPLIKELQNFIFWYIKELWVGLKDIFDNLSTILTVASIVFIAMLWSANWTQCTIVNPIDTQTVTKVIKEWNPFER